MSTYPFYPERKTISLNGIWDFAWLGDCNIDQIMIAEVVFNEVMAVPGLFDTTPAYSGKRGVGIYRCVFLYPTTTQQLLRLKFGGAGLFCRIWVDGQEIGQYDLPYSSVDYDFRVTGRENHELIIAVDNRFDFKHSPLFAANFDFYAYGGIYRHIEIQSLPELYLERVYVTTKDISSGTVELKIILGGEIPSTAQLELSFDDNIKQTCEVNISDGIIILHYKVPDFKLWSPENPALHTVTVSIAHDTITERFGIRTVSTSGEQILLNGKALFLRGVCRHEAHPEFGPVQPSQLMINDLLLLKELHCNFVRCVHYPQDQRFLDLCDQIGMLVWQESMGWNNSEANALDAHFFELQVRQTKLMAKNSYNHPSIILWGFLNECCSNTQGGYKLYETLARSIRSINPEFLVTYASNKIGRTKEGIVQDICFDLVDVVAYNTYPGWIDPKPEWTDTPFDLIEPEIKRLSYISDTHPKVKGKPVLFSEIGTCALYGCHDIDKAQWSEEFQAEYVEKVCRAIFADQRFSGVALWQFFDTRSYVNAAPGVRCKPRGFNCAGLLDEYRRRKLAFSSIKELFMTHKASHESKFST